MTHSKAGKDDKQLNVRVAVNASARKEHIQERTKDCFDIAVKEPAQGGRANLRVCQLIAKHYSVALKKVRIVAGQKRPRKRLSVALY